MLANLMPPTAAPPVIAPVRTRPSGGFLVVHPRYRTWLARCGIASAADAIDLPGEVVSGHPDRHVMRVELGTGGRTLYLKREHRVGWRVRLRNHRAGFGWASRSEREAKVLDALERGGRPGPQWAAYGEDGRGRAFLLVDDLTGSAELRDALADPTADRRALAGKLGQALAELHVNGFDTPDACAKHVFARGNTGDITLIDWASATPDRPVSPHQRVRALATVSASVSDKLAGVRDRLRVLRAYRAAGGFGGPFAAVARTIAAEEKAVRDRPSAREQRQPAGKPQRLVWLAGEAAVAVPDAVPHWPTPAAGRPFYPARFEPATGAALPLALPDGVCTLRRYRSTAALPRLVAGVRSRPWRSPAAVVARLLFHLERYGVEVPALVGYGQRTNRLRAESFVVYRLAADAPPLADVLADSWLPLANKRRLLFALGAAVRGVHEARCVVRDAAIRVERSATRLRLVIDPAAGVGRCRSPRRQRENLIQLVKQLTLSRAEAGRVLAGYRAGDPTADRSLTAAVLRRVGRR